MCCPMPTRAWYIEALLGTKFVAFDERLASLELVAYFLQSVFTNSTTILIRFIGEASSYVSSGEYMSPNKGRENCEFFHLLLATLN